MEILSIIAGVFIGSMLSDIIRGRRAKLAGRLDRLEQKMDLILSHLRIELPAVNASQQVINLMAAGQKIQAIKAYREETGAGLAEAKQAVENLAGRLAISGAVVQPSIGRPGDELDQQHVTQVKRGLD